MELKLPSYAIPPQTNPTLTSCGGNQRLACWRLALHSMTMTGYRGTVELNRNLARFPRTIPCNLSALALVGLSLLTWDGIPNFRALDF
jgi:hypothetical protein